MRQFSPFRHPGRLAAASLLSLAAGCAGVPLSSTAYFAALGPRVLETDPAVLAVAVLHDQRLPLEREAAPELRIRIAPRVEGAFPVLQERLRMHPVQQATPALPPAARGMQWRAYALTPAQAERLTQVQQEFRALKARKLGGSAEVGVGMQSLALSGASDRHDDMALEVWVRIARDDGFVKAWAGRMADVRKARR